MLYSLKNKSAFANVLDAQKKHKPKSHDLGFVVCAANTELGQTELDQTELDQNIGLGLIVPKRAYKLAVDRNRIKRVARAACQNVLLAKESSVACDLVLLVKSKSKLHAPQSQLFSKALSETISSALKFNSKSRQC